MGLEISEVDVQPRAHVVYFSDPDGNAWPLQQIVRPADRAAELRKLPSGAATPRRCAGGAAESTAPRSADHS